MSSASDRDEVLSRMRGRDAERSRVVSADVVEKRVGELRDEAPSASRSDRMAAAFYRRGMDEDYLAEKVELLLEAVREVKVWEKSESGAWESTTKLVADVVAVEKGLRMMFDALGLRFEQDKVGLGAVPVQLVQVYNDFRRDSREKSPSELLSEVGVVDAG